MFLGAVAHEILGHRRTRNTHTHTHSVGLAMSEAEFDSAAQVGFVDSIAAASGVSSSAVEITGAPLLDRPCLLACVRCTWSRHSPFVCPGFQSLALTLNSTLSTTPSCFPSGACFCACACLPVRVCICRGAVYHTSKGGRHQGGSSN